MKKILMILMVLFLMMALAPIAMAEAPPAEPAPGIDLTPLFQAVIALLASLVTLMLIPWIKARTTEKQQDLLRAAVSVSVYAAEQIYGAGNGKEKFMYVKGRLAEKGFHIDIDEIEAAVRELTLSQQPGYTVLTEPAQDSTQAQTE